MQLLVTKAGKGCMLSIWAFLMSSYSLKYRVFHEIQAVSRITPYSWSQHQNDVVQNKTFKWYLQFFVGKNSFYPTRRTSSCHLLRNFIRKVSHKVSHQVFSSTHWAVILTLDLDFRFEVRKIFVLLKIEPTAKIGVH